MEAKSFLLVLVPELMVALPAVGEDGGGDPRPLRSEEHTSELQSRTNLVCRLLLEKKKKKYKKK